MILWTFDGNTNDFSGVYNGQPINNPTYVSPGYTGYGSMLHLQSALNQSVVVETPVLNLGFTSFTMEAWIYPMTVSSAGDDNIFSQCQALATDQCLHFVLASRYLRMRFFGDGSQGVTPFTANKWYHIACVYDYTLTAQIVYVNGVRDGFSSPSGPYQGTGGIFEIGTASVDYGGVFTPFNGYIDQVAFVPRAKNATEVLDDATLVAYYSFDNGSYLDFGPLWINGTGVGVSPVVGRISQALSFATTHSYFQATGFTLLGTVNQSYSISLWLKPQAVSGGATIVHVSSSTIGTGWCIPMIGLSASGQIITQSWNNTAVAVTGPILTLNVWTHVVETYSVMNGIRMYLNGTLYGSTGAFFYMASNVPNTITLGNPLNGTSCTSALFVAGQYQGAMDEFRLYSRELNSTDVYSLANP
ncbi:unnamed protein product [Didymodactylos carnosus]|uniref:LamG-like jellyroll fold domain-containing protein n=1 Tax=Didymodactylos carnosus TaxID=1234261 RepID=A0A815BAK4_9BILA|nr:unnamed protein product [Didymodactylos carnosus]CAF1265067.1 unnamed protein product [Didymodactylos carnosus]CAF3675496.1 unnamed protein product [Didymodactylos carnosus]CAF4047193.1 unnamed protein product [Didymodactylos carnosus]